jgi:ureidoglycolate dehydrogenase (NAD+)
VIVALLSTSLAGVDIVQDEPGDEQKGLGGFFLCINPEAFVPRELFEESVAGMVAHLRTTPPAEPFERVFVPGEPEAISRERRAQEGIPLPESVWADVQAAVGEAPPPPVE